MDKQGVVANYEKKIEEIMEQHSAIVKTMMDTFDDEMTEMKKTMTNNTNDMNILRQRLKAKTEEFIEKTKLHDSISAALQAEKKKLDDYIKYNNELIETVKIMQDEQIENKTKVFEKLNDVCDYYDATIKNISKTLIREIEQLKLNKNGEFESRIKEWGNDCVVILGNLVKDFQRDFSKIKPQNETEIKPEIKPEIKTEIKTEIKIENKTENVPKNVVREDNKMSQLPAKDELKCAACGTCYKEKEMDRHNETCPEMYVMCDLDMVGECNIQVKRKDMKSHTASHMTSNKAVNKIEYIKGLYIDVLDCEFIWVPAEILEVQNDRIFIKYLNWESVYNIWMDTIKESYKILPYGTITKSGIHVGLVIYIRDATKLWVPAKVIVIEQKSFVCQCMYDNKLSEIQFYETDRYNLWSNAYDLTVGNYYSLLVGNVWKNAKLVEINKYKFNFVIIDEAQDVQNCGLKPKITINYHDVLACVRILGSQKICGVHASLMNTS